MEFPHKDTGQLEADFKNLKKLRMVKLMLPDYDVLETVMTELNLKVLDNSAFKLQVHCPAAVDLAKILKFCSKKPYCIEYFIK